MSFAPVLPHNSELTTYCSPFSFGEPFNLFVHLNRHKNRLPFGDVHCKKPYILCFCKRIYRTSCTVASKKVALSRAQSRVKGGKYERKAYFASPQLGPISTSHLLGTSKGTAFSMIVAIDSASSRFFTDIAISS